MIELLVRVLLELAGDVLEARGVDLLAEDHVLDDRLVLPGKILLQPLDRAVRVWLAWSTAGSGVRGASDFAMIGL